MSDAQTTRIQRYLSLAAFTRTVSVTLILLFSAVASAFWGTSLSIAGVAAPSQFGQTESTISAYECTQVSIDDIDESLLTREERIALMDASLSDSIDSYTSCVNTVQSQMSGGGSGSGGAAGSDGSAPDNTQNNADQSAQSNSQQAEQNAQGSGAPQAGSSAVSSQNQTTKPVQRGIIAPKDNDSIICKLLFDEMQKASGPSLAGLEKQYRDYQCGN